MRYGTIIFDMDGTLLNTLDDLAASVNYAMDRLGFPRRRTDEVMRFVGNGVHTLIRRAAPDGITEEEYWAAYDAFEKHYAAHNRDKTAPYPGVRELLGELKRRGCKLAIVSNKIDFAVQALREEFFDGLVDAAVGDSEDTENKPAPDMVYKAARLLGSELSDCVYIGDTNVDLDTAKNAGIPCIAVSWGFRTRAELEGYGAKEIIDRAEELPELL